MGGRAEISWYFVHLCRPYGGSGRRAVSVYVSVLCGLVLLGVGLFCPAHRTAGLLAVSQEEVLRHRIAVLCVQRHQRGGECAHLGLFIYRICRPGGCGVHGRADKDSGGGPVVPSVPVRDFDWALPAEETPAVGMAGCFGGPRLLRGDGDRHSLPAGGRAAHVLRHRQRDVLYPLLCFGRGAFSLFEGLPFSFVEAMGKGALLGCDAGVCICRMCGLF